uniref:Poly(A) polymerase n=1 Tax=Rhabditophanes sp. KR3021 TaxID=114890 RepID=A0AC35TLH9_9BILA
MSEFLTKESPRYGISRSICCKEPTLTELFLSKKLEEQLREYDLFESQEGINKRIEVLRVINSMFKKWVRKASEGKVATEFLDEVGGKLFTFGSYRLGVNSPGADIDSLCVAPRHITRADFFTSFYKELEEDPDATELHAVQDAFVPLIKLKYRDVELDLLFARLAERSVPDSQTLDSNDLLKNLEEKCVRSLNGCRVADEILKSVPNPDTYRGALRAIKHWAKVRGIYSNVLGFFGGITWAILTARCCQLYPNATVSRLITKFFYILHNWEWPHPIFLKDAEQSDKTNQLTSLVWDPRQRNSDRYHLMPIITPAFPEQNSTFNVSTSTKKIIMNEISEGFNVCRELIMGECGWSKLFEEINFFSRYKHFLMTFICSPNEEVFLNFKGLVESKLRHLTTSFERNEVIELVHVCAKTFKPTLPPTYDLGKTFETPYMSCWFIGLVFKKNMKIEVELTSEIQTFHDLIVNTNYKIHPNDESSKIDLKYLRRNKVKEWISPEDFKKGRKILNAKEQEKLDAFLEKVGKAVDPCDINGYELFRKNPDLNEEWLKFVADETDKAAQLNSNGKTRKRSPKISEMGDSFFKRQRLSSLSSITTDSTVKPSNETVVSNV